MIQGRFSILRWVWPAFWILAFLILCFASPRLRAESSLTLYYYPSETEIRWKRPSLLAHSILVSEVVGLLTPQTFKRYPIGHVHVAVKCDLPYRGMSEVYTGMTNKDNLEMNNAVLRRGLGLSVLFYPFEGRYETDEEVKAKIAARMKWRRVSPQVYRGNIDFQRAAQAKARMKVSFLKLLLNDSNCQRLLQYVQEYRERGVHQVYSLHSNPLKCEGAGCSAYGRSFLQVAGLLDGSLKDDPVVRFVRALDTAAMKQVRVPEALMGDDSKGKFVNIFEMASRGLHWAKPHEAGRDLVFWDPTHWHDAIQEALYKPHASKLRALLPADTEFERVPSMRPSLFPKGRGFVLDARHIQVAPDRPIFSPACDN